MNFEGISRIQAVMARIKEIESRFTPPSQQCNGIEGHSFDAHLAMAMDQNLSAGGNVSPSQMYSFMNPVGMGGMSAWLGTVAASNPEKVIDYKGFRMQAQTAVKFEKLERLIAVKFPGREISITSSMDGKHMDPNHPAGKAVDFVVSGLTKDESRTVEELCSQAGFKPYNEYINSSPYKTGDHMHVDVI
ncbi:MAG: hypothetical protein M1536_04745 [Firmicutes bacterium]|nr:hypothetical protein [Bacillota bacterium]